MLVLLGFRISSGKNGILIGSLCCLFCQSVCLTRAFFQERLYEYLKAIGTKKLSSAMNSNTPYQFVL